MAGHAAHPAHRPTPRRPGMVKAHHTWHGETAYQSHFEDFMREIGVDAQATHLCCVPRQATRFSIRVRSHSEPALVAAQENTEDTAPHTSTARPRPSLRRLSLPSHLLKPAPPSRTPSAFAPRARTTSSSSSGSTSPTSPLKTPPLTCVYTQNHPAAHLTAFPSAHTALRTSTRAGTLDGPWTPLAHRPALAPEPAPIQTQTTTPTQRLSRVPSFASLATVSSSEGPPTPRGPTPPTLAPLAQIEKKARLRVPGRCGTCARAGHDFPSCATCGGRWCSRACRVRGVHLCDLRKGEGVREGAAPLVSCES